MKKILIVLVLTLIFTACEYRVQDTQKSNNKRVVENITYFKDSKTGLCFAAVNSRTSYGYYVTSITCVPCDSLKNKNVEISILNYQY